MTLKPNVILRTPKYNPKIIWCTCKCGRFCPTYNQELEWKEIYVRGYLSKPPISHSKVGTALSLEGVTHAALSR